MADDTRLPLGTLDGDTYRSDENTGLGGNPKTQVVKIELGLDGTFSGFVAATNPLPSTEFRASAAPTEGSFTSVADAQILAAAATRKSFSISNDSDQVLFVRYGATAVSATEYRVRIAPGDFYSDDGWSGEVRGILAGAIGSGQVRFSAEAA